MSRSIEALAIAPHGKRDETPSALVGNIVLGKDILELLSTAMYVDPRTLYREYVQNAADGIDGAVAAGLFGPGVRGRVDIQIDPVEREICVRDNGIGIPASDTSRILTALGASTKRGSRARGFRGVGRLAGVGFCQYLTFRTRARGEILVSEVRWDCRRLKTILRDAHYAGDLQSVMREVVTLRDLHEPDAPPHFFEVRLEKVVRIKNDVLLNTGEVSSYLSQVGPVPMPAAFAFTQEIEEHLRPLIAPPRFDVFLNGSAGPIVRPFEDEFIVSGKKTDRFTELQTLTLPAIDGGTAAVGWLLHHGYTGALRRAPHIRGLRARVGDVQVGGSDIFMHVFPEERFASWTVGEIHVLDPRIVPNGRRDDFEQNGALFHIVNQLAPIARDIARRCRVSSRVRNQMKQFAGRDQKIGELLDVLQQGALNRTAAQGLNKQVGALVAQLEQAAQAEFIPPGDRHLLQHRAAILRRRFEQLRAAPVGNELLRQLPPHRRAPYAEVFQLIYECSGNHRNAKTLIDRIASRILGTHVPKRRKGSPARGRRRGKRQ